MLPLANQRVLIQIKESPHAIGRGSHCPGHSLVRLQRRRECRVREIHTWRAATYFPAGPEWLECPLEETRALMARGACWHAERGSG